MTIVGGLRQRLIYDSLFYEIERILDALGYLTAGPSGSSFIPVTLLNEPVDDRTEVPLNTCVLVGEDKRSDPWEMGSNYAEHVRTFYVDLYAQSLSVGEQIIFDLEAALEGRMSSIGRGSASFEIYDYTQATPPVIAVGQIEDVSTDRGRSFSYPWEKYWWSIQFQVIDKYGDEDDN